MAAFWVIALIMEAVSTSETSVNFYQTTLRNILEGGHENMKFHVECGWHFCFETLLDRTM
jgi:hypothetical protein